MRYKIIIPILVCMLFITACGNSDTGNTQSTGAFIGGSEGIDATFEPFGVEEDNIYSLFETEAFPIEIRFQNKGEYEIQPGDINIELLGPSEEEFTGIANRNLQNQDLIEKISELVPNGGEEIITFATDAQYNTDVTGYIDREWFANIDYNYQTKIVMPEICLKEDLTDKRVCTVKESKTFFVSGSPIQATTVDESTSGRGIMAVKIAIENVGDGKVAKLDGEFGVSDRLGFSLDDQAWECKSAGKINEARLVDGKADVVCKLKEPLAEKTLSTKQLTLTLNFKYREIIQEKVRIKQSDE
jgi:hypothetical protein